MNRIIIRVVIEKVELEEAVEVKKAIDRILADVERAEVEMSVLPTREERIT